MMPSVTERLTKAGLASPPAFVSSNICYETVMGSTAYGVAGDLSDMDVYGFCIPSREVVFPHLGGEIAGFGRQKKRFDVWQQQHIKAASGDIGKEKEYDLSIFNIVRYFHLCMDCNPNMIDSLFTPLDCVLHTTHVGEIVRDNRRLFLHKGAWHRFKGYAYAQLHKMKNKNPEGKRIALVEEFGYDVKFAYHVVRLLTEVEQIMEEGDIDLRRNREQLKSVRRGEWTEQEIRDWATDKERGLEKLYQSSKLPHSPDEGPIKEVLLGCLEHHYGSIDECVIDVDQASQSLRNIADILRKSHISFD
jgi:predicted nucleotidyltransferase